MPGAITRRQFIDGMACALLAGCATAGRSGAGAPPAAGAGYPPGLTGWRGSREADYATAHALRDGRRFDGAALPVDEEVDAVVVGAGIAGLASAVFLRQALPGARLLILDNHDDFGGHARRNEFQVDGRLLIGYGGSESIQSPRSLWSPVALGMLEQLGVRLARFESAIDTPLYPGLGMSSAVFFRREDFGRDALVTGDPQRSLPSDIPPALQRGRPVAEFAALCPLSDDQRRSLVALFEEPRDVLAGVPQDGRAQALATISYRDFLVRLWGLDPAVARIFTDRMYDFFAIPGSLIPALGAASNGYPGFQGLGPLREDGSEYEPYIHHFPDGNASLARLMVRQLIPEAAAGSTMEDIVSARFDYGRLDLPGQPARLRLSSTVVQMSNGAGTVDIVYERGGALRKVRCRDAIFAGYLSMLPYVLADAPAPQRALMSQAVRAPLIYVNVALRRWDAWVKTGAHLINNPLGFYKLAKLDYPVSLGSYRFARSPGEPIVAHLSHIPHPLRDPVDRVAALKAARYDAYKRPFSDYEAALRDELGRMLGAGGFDADRDIAAITVNRWGHGYAYEPTPLTDPDATDEQIQAARAPVGRISIAGTDTARTAYAHAAIDEAHRAAAEVAARRGG